MPTLEKRAVELLEGEVFRILDVHQASIDHKFYYYIRSQVKNVHSRLTRVYVRTWHGEAVGPEFVLTLYEHTNVHVVHDTVPSIEC